MKTLVLKTQYVKEQIIYGKPNFEAAQAFQGEIILGFFDTSTKAEAVEVANRIHKLSLTEEMVDLYEYCNQEKKQKQESKEINGKGKSNCDTCDHKDECH